MKKLLKSKFPTLFRILKNNPYHKNKIIKQKQIHLRIREQIKVEELSLMKNVFDNIFMVHNGPFKGMKYIESSTGSAFLPKIMGSYEEPIHSWIEEVFIKKYSRILDIGCAEGYYACGFAKNLPNSQVFAYDIDSIARENTTLLKDLNQLNNIEIKSNCDFNELNEKSTSDTLIFCDIEGYEEILLDPLKAPNLKKADLIIESHDFINNKITEKLINRFKITHSIRIVVDYDCRLNKYQTPLDCTKEQFNRITNEYRPSFMKFLYLKSMYGKI